MLFQPCGRVCGRAARLSILLQGPLAFPRGGLTDRASACQSGCPPVSACDPGRGPGIHVSCEHLPPQEGQAGYGDAGGATAIHAREGVGWQAWRVMRGEAWLAGRLSACDHAVIRPDVLQAATRISPSQSFQDGLPLSYCYWLFHHMHFAPLPSRARKRSILTACAGCCMVSGAWCCGRHVGAVSHNSQGGVRAMGT